MNTIKTVIGNTESDYVTTINILRDESGYLYLTQKRLENALNRMKASPTARLRYVEVSGARIEAHHIEIRRRNI